MKNTRIIIAAIFGSIVISVLLLAYTEQRQVRDGENFWSVAFTDPLGATNDICIDNRMPRDTAFHYRVHTADNTTLADAEITIPARSTHTIVIPHPAPITVTVTANDEVFTLSKKENNLAQ